MQMLQINLIMYTFAPVLERKKKIEKKERKVV